MNVAALQAERARLLKWRLSNMDKINTEDYRKNIETDRLLADLIARNGGPPAEQAYAMSKLNETSDMSAVEF